jgi:tetratricopeptide (TPR) repeat protein
MRITIFFVIFLSAVSAFGQSRQTVELFQSGIVASKSREHEKALKDFEQTLLRAKNEHTANKFVAKVHYNLGVSRFHLNRLDEATADFKKAIDLANGRYEKASYSLGLTRTELGDSVGAERAFLDALAVNKQNGEAWFDLAFVYLNRKEYKPAQTAFANAIRFGTIDPAVGHNNLGVLFAMNGNMSDAEKHFRSAVAVGTLHEAVLNLEKCRRFAEAGEKLLAFNFIWNRSNKI